MDPASAPESGPPGNRELVPESWAQAIRGLDIYRQALLLILITAIGGTLIALFIMFSRGPAEIMTVLRFLVFTNIIVVLLAARMIGGLWRFYQLPAETGARDMTKVALFFSALGLLGQGTELYLLASAVFGAGSTDEVEQLAGGTPFTILARLGMVVGFICLVVALRKVALYLRAGDVIEQFKAFMVIVSIAVALMVVGAVSGSEAIRGVCGVAVLALAIVALKRFLGILKSLTQAIKQQT